MIYTSYFAQMKNFPDNFIPISICGGVPKWYKGLQYKKVAPKWGFFKEWKENNDNDFYIQHFNDEVLSQLDPIKFLYDIQMLSGLVGEPITKSKDVHVVLLCYEKPNDFCHRHLVADWVNNGLSRETITEWKK